MEMLMFIVPILFSIVAGLCCGHRFICFFWRALSWLIAIYLVFMLFEDGYNILALLGAAAVIFFKEVALFMTAALWASHTGEDLPDFLGMAWIAVVGISGLLANCTFIVVIFMALHKVLTS